MMTIDGFIDGIEHLPSAPRTLSRLLSLLQAVDVSMDDVVQEVEIDPGLTAEVMRLCNSAYVGGHRPCSDLVAAIGRIGFKQVFELAACLSSHSLYEIPDPPGCIDVSALWRHCFASAIVGKSLSEPGDDEGVVFTACILHDLGKVVLALGLRDEYAQLLTQARRRHIPSFAVEDAVLRFNHAQVGARLLERWNFPTELAEAVRYHHTPGEAPSESRLPAYVFLSDLMASFMGHDGGEAAVTLVERTQALQRIGRSAQDLASLTMPAVESLAQREPLLQMAE